MSPVSSATGMNSAGGTMPRSGWRQRSERLEADDAPGLEIELGLIVERELERSERAAQVVFQRPDGWCAAAFICGREELVVVRGPISLA